jgi:hypothetical protein
MQRSSSRACVLTLLISPFLEQARLDAGLAAELDPCYGKAHYRCHSCVTRMTCVAHVTCAASHTDTHRRKGIATLGMPETQQRSKEAVMALQVRLCVCVCVCAFVCVRVYVRLCVNLQ